jgi:preprotein translocase subunit SecG
MIFVLLIHVLVCLGLIALVLIQRGRGSGLVEAFSGVESMFGTKTPEFLTRATTVLSIIFFITCLSLAFMSLRQSKSLMRSVTPEAVKTGETLPVQQEAPSVPATQANTQEAPKAE